MECVRGACPEETGYVAYRDDGQLVVDGRIVNGQIQNSVAETAVKMMQAFIDYHGDDPTI